MGRFDLKAVLALFTNMQVLCPWAARSAMTNQVFLVPPLLPPTPPASVHTDWGPTSPEPCLRRYFRFAVWPSALFQYVRARKHPNSVTRKTDE